MYMLSLQILAHNTKPVCQRHTRYRAPCNAGRSKEIVTRQQHVVVRSHVLKYLVQSLSVCKGSRTHPDPEARGCNPRP